MKINIVCLGIVISMLQIFNLNAHPMIRSIRNKTPFIFRVVGHNDVSDCSDFNAGKIVEIAPHSKFTQPLLLGSEKPGLLLRPVAFYDQKNKETHWFVNENGDIDKDLLTHAFHAWEKSSGRKYKKGVEVWFAQWLCGDISLIHNHVEVFGYLLNVSIARIDNEKNYHACQVDYSEGLFSRLIIDVTIAQQGKKGIVPHVKSFVGQGGLCQDGQIIFL